MFDIVFVGTNEEQFNKLKQKVFIAKKADSVEKAQQISLTKFLWIVYDDLEIANDFEFDYTPDDWSQDVAHVFLNGKDYDGISLIPKHIKFNVKETQHRFYIQSKKVEVLASNPVAYDHFYVDTYKEYLHAMQTSKTEMFWVDSRNIKSTLPDIYFTHHDTYNRKENHAFIHDVDERILYNGLFLCSTHKPITEKEINFRHLVSRKEWDIVGSTATTYDIFKIDTYDEYQFALQNTKTEMFWAVSRNLSFELPNIYFTHDNQFDRENNHVFLHCDSKYNGVFLFSKHKLVTEREITHRHIVDRKEWNINASGPIVYDLFEIDTYDDYLYALENSETEMFWMSSANISVDLPEIYFTHDNAYDRMTNHSFLHVNDKRNGLFLLSKHKEVTKREIEHRHIVGCKEWDILGSGPIEYAKYYPEVYEDYLDALQNSPTEMFWIIPPYVNPTARFAFDTYFTHDQTYDRKINHAYLNGKYHDGIVLCSKYGKFSRREFDYKFIANKKEVNIAISTPKPYDIVFISYQEPNADENYERILQRFPQCKRVHGVKGIHQAHIAGAKLCNTELFWIIDGDATIVDDFNFDYQVARWDKEMVHVWRSQNPINDMVYGYGGVKLFPTDLTINMDTSKPDMTTSISTKFKAVHDISNITAFNTDAFNSFKSAFRECTKLASKVIDRQKNEETEDRLQIWQTVGKERPYGEDAIRGAREGAAYGAANQGNTEALKKINDFDWLKEKFDGNI